MDHKLRTIFNSTTLIFVSVLHLGQYRGKFRRTVLLYTLVLVFIPHTGHRTQYDSLS